MLAHSQEPASFSASNREDNGYVSYRDILLRNIPTGYSPQLPVERPARHTQNVSSIVKVSNVPTTIITNTPLNTTAPFCLALPSEIKWLLQSIVHLSQPCPILTWRNSFMTSDTEDIRGICSSDLTTLDGSPDWAQGHDIHGRFYVAVHVQDTKHNVKGVLTIFQRYIPVDNSTSVNLTFDAHEKQALNNCWKIAYNGTPCAAQALAMQEGYWQQGDSRAEYIKSLIDGTVGRRHYGQ